METTLIAETPENYPNVQKLLELINSTENPLQTFETLKAILQPERNRQQ